MRSIPIFLILALLLALCGCAAGEPSADIAATTLPVYEFTSRLCQGTGLTTARLVTESVSCLHDYSLNVRQVRAAEASETIVISGAGLEDFMSGLLLDKPVIDASTGITLLDCTHEHEDADAHDHTHHHETDSHIWLSPENAMTMAENICAGLCAQYPEHSAAFQQNLQGLLADLSDLQEYGQEQLRSLSCRELITFHDGFSYLADSFDLHILEAVEEESGSEASAAVLKHLITEVREHDLPAIFTETNGSSSAASVIARETGAELHTLDMAMAGDSYFEAMYRNFDTIREALG